MDAWAQELGAAITVCDRAGRILDLNDRAAKTFEKGKYRGFVELSFEIPEKMPHFVRK